MTDDHRTPRADVVDEAASVRRFDVGAGGAAHEDGLAPHAPKGAHRGIDAARDVLAGLLIQAQRDLLHGSQASTAAGRASSTSKPPPGRLTACAAPPWALSTCEVMARPMPSPPESRSRDSATR